MKFNLTTGYSFAALLLLLQLNAIAQKLPNEQKNGIVAPGNVKVDGKATEWGAFQAYNRATEIFYTMANDAENLYLVVQAIKPDKKTDVIGKILAGGITLSIKSKDKKEKPLMVTFPLIERMKNSEIMMMIKNTEVNQDSMLRHANQQLEANSKDIALSGFKEISEPKISVYNEEGIKAVSLFDTKRSWTYELKLPLKYIQHLLDDTASFDYKIIVNGVDVPHNMIMVSGSPIGGGSISLSSSPAFDAFSPTNLSARYTLIKQ